MLDIEIRQLEYFVTAAECGSFSNAARKLMISQQALSKGIQQLEKLLGEDLFRRTKTGVSFTEFGSYVYQYATIALRTVHQITHASEEYHRGIHKVIRIGIPPLCFKEKGGSLSLKSFLTLQQTFDQATFQCEELSVNEIRQRILQQELDFGIVSIPGERDISSLVLRRYPMAAVVLHENKLSELPYAFPADLEGFSLIMIQNDKVVENYLKLLGEMHGFKMAHSPLAVNTCLGSDYLYDNNTVVIEPLAHALRTESRDAVAVIPLRAIDNTPLLLPLCLIWHNERALDIADRKILQYFKTLYTHANFDVEIKSQEDFHPSLT